MLSSFNRAWLLTRFRGLPTCDDAAAHASRSADALTCGDARKADEEAALAHAGVAEGPAAAENACAPPSADARSVVAPSACDAGSSVQDAEPFENRRVGCTGLVVALIVAHVCFFPIIMNPFGKRRVVC